MLVCYFSFCCDFVLLDSGARVFLVDHVGMLLTFDAFLIIRLQFS